MKPDVIIIGAGAAGMMAARILCNAGRRVLLLEARNRIGGRIWTIGNPRGGNPIELGPEFIHGRPKVTWDLVNEAAIPVVDLPDDHRWIQRGRLVDGEKIQEKFGRVMGGLAHVGKKDESFATFLEKQKRRHGGADWAATQRLALTFVEGFDAADVQRISAKSLADEQEGLGDIDNETQFRLLHGYGMLIEFLHLKIREAKAEVRLNAPVSEIRWKRRSATVFVGKRAAATAPKVIITLPLGVMQLEPGVAGAVQFEPDIPHWRETARGLAPGSVMKAVLTFREMFWEQPPVGTAAKSKAKLADANFIHAPDAQFPTWWTQRPARLPMLTAWAGGPKANQLAALSPAALRQAALESLASWSGLSVKRLDRTLTRLHAHNWQSDPYCRGAYSYVTVGGGAARAKLANPIDDTLFFAGEAIGDSDQASTVAGALESGERAARLVLKKSKINRR
jgi:monoamine oxidase